MLNSTQLLIIGSGLAGLATAIKAANSGIQVTILTKEKLTESSSYYAQGGIAAVWGLDDTFESHIQDTLDAGAGLCNRSAVEFIVNRGPDAIRWLIDSGVSFSQRSDQKNHFGEFHLTREGGHSNRRVIHAADATGRQVETTLESKIRNHENITICERMIAIDLITEHKNQSPRNNRCIGAYALDIVEERVKTFVADAVVIATGGASKVYLYTSNPDTSTGDGMAMAWRAGCSISNMEFIQFHPTCLYHPQAKSFLVSEAVRGEGGKLILPDSSPFMYKYDEREELAPRDIVARAIDHEMKVGGHDCVYLDITMKSKDFLMRHFPNIFAKCLSFGIDISQHPIPVVPAAHYTCGGVRVNQSGRTDLSGLYCIGESACTGLHGANRLASNSLLECVVLAHSAFEDICKCLNTTHTLSKDIPLWDESQVTDPAEMVVVAHNWDELRRTLWNYVGIVRTEERLKRAQRRIKVMIEEIREFYGQFKVSRDLVELRNLVQVAELIVSCALSRKESRGLHYLVDYPNINPKLAKDTVVTPKFSN